MKQLMKILESWKTRSKAFKIVSIIALVSILYLGCRGVVFAEEQVAVEEEVVEEVTAEPEVVIVEEEVEVEVAEAIAVEE